MRAITFILNKPAPSLNELLRMDRRHWSVRRKFKKQLAAEVLMALREAGHGLPASPMRRVRLTVERGSAGTLDDDNLTGGLKELVDVLVWPTRRNPHGLGLIVDDNRECIVERDYQQAKAPPKKGFTRVCIEELPA